MGYPAGVSKAEAERIRQERFGAVRSIVASGDRSPASIINKVKNLPCFTRVSFEGIKNFLKNHRDELEIPKRGPWGKVLTDLSDTSGKTESKDAIIHTQTPATIPAKTELNDILSCYTSLLSSYEESQKFNGFVETHLRPHVCKLEDRTLLIPQLEAKVSELLQVIAELREHQCPDVASDAKHEIQDLSDANQNLGGELERLKQRNKILADDNEELRKRRINTSDCLAVDSQSTRRGAERQL